MPEQLPEQPVGGEVLEAPPDVTPTEGPGIPQLGGSVELPILSSSETPQDDEPGSEQDQAARYTDIELLGKSFRVRRAVQVSGTKAFKAWEGMKAKIHNAFDTPGKAIRQFAYNRAKNSYARKQDRQQAAQSARLYQRRQGAVDRAKERLGQRGISLQNHVGRMEARTQAVSEHEQQRRQEFVNELKARKEKSLANKAIRAQLRAEGASRRETRTIMSEIPAEHIGRVGEVAIAAETSRREFANTQRLYKKTANLEHRTGVRVNRTESRMGALDEQVRAADESAVRINTDYLPFARSRVETLGAELDELEDGSPERQTLIAELQNAKAEVAAFEAQLDFWRETAKYYRGRSEKADKHLGGLYERQEELGTKIGSLTEQEISLRDKHMTHSKQLGKVVRAALNPSKTGKED